MTSRARTPPRTWLVQPDQTLPIYSSGASSSAMKDPGVFITVIIIINDRQSRQPRKSVRGIHGMLFERETISKREIRFMRTQRAVYSHPIPYRPSERASASYPRNTKCAIFCKRIQRPLADILGYLFHSGMVQGLLCTSFYNFHASVLNNYKVY